MNNREFIDDRLVTYIYNGNQVRATYNDENKNENRHFVMWSGGTDSTCLLYELLDTYGADNVYAVSYKYPWLLEDKWKTEQKYREAFKAKMKLREERFSNFSHVEIETKISHLQGDYINPSHGKQMGLPQAVGWLLSVPIYIPDNSYIYTGAIRIDDLTIMREEYYQMFTGIAKTLGKNIILREPYLYLSKEDIIEKLMLYELYDETWTCEMPPEPGKLCGKCVPCLTHINALNALSNGYVYHKINDSVKIKAKKELEKINNIIKENNRIDCVDKESISIEDDD